MRKHKKNKMSGITLIALVVTIIVLLILAGISIPNGVEELGKWAFGYGNLASITIPSSITNIDKHAFDGCSLLTNITINKPTDSISGAPWGAPSGCTITWTGDEIP